MLRRNGYQRNLELIVLLFVAWDAPVVARKNTRGGNDGMPGRNAKKRLRFQSVIEQEQFEREGWIFVTPTRQLHKKMGTRVDTMEIPAGQREGAQETVENS